MWIDRSLNGGACRLRRNHIGFGHGKAVGDPSVKEKSGCKHKMPKSGKNQLLMFFCVLSGQIQVFAGNPFIDLQAPFCITIDFGSQEFASVGKFLNGARALWRLRKSCTCSVQGRQKLCSTILHVDCGL